MSDLIIPAMPEGYSLGIDFDFDLDLRVTVYRDRDSYGRFYDGEPIEVGSTSGTVTYLQEMVDKLVGKINKGVEYVGTYKKVE